YHQQDEPHVAVLSSRLARVDRRPDLHLDVTQQYRVVEAEGERGPWKVTIVEYDYSILNEDFSEFLVYHWHPDSSSPEKRPHLHIGGESGKAHVPTGRVALEDVLRFCIRDLEVQPLREDWSDILDATQGAFETWRTWG